MAPWLSGRTPLGSVTVTKENWLAYTVAEAIPWIRVQVKGGTETREGNIFSIPGELPAQFSACAYRTRTGSCRGLPCPFQPCIDVLSFIQASTGQHGGRRFNACCGSCALAKNRCNHVLRSRAQGPGSETSAFQMCARVSCGVALCNDRSPRHAATAQGALSHHVRPQLLDVTSDGADGIGNFSNLLARCSVPNRHPTRCAVAASHRQDTRHLFLPLPLYSPNVSPNSQQVLSSTAALLH